MNLQEALKTFLIANCPLAAGRVTAKAIKTGSGLPALTYQQLTPGGAILAHDGPSGLFNATFQLTAWAATYEEANALAAQVRASLDGYRGAMSGLTVHRAAVADAQDDTDTALSTHKTIMQLKLIYRS